MTERDDLDLEPELDDAWDDDLEDDFPADKRADKSEPAASAPVEPPTKPRRRASRHAGGGLGGLAATLVVLGALPLAAGLYFALQGSYTTLLDFEGLTNPANWSDLAAHPATAFWLGAAATMLLAILAGVAVGVRARRAARAARETRDVLRIVGALDLEDAKSWQDPCLQAHPDLAAFSEKTMGAFRLQQAKLSRYIGLEGELHRLGRALSQASKADLEGEWDSPTVGTVADEALRLLVESVRLRDELAAKERVSADQGPELVEGLHEARSWNSATLDQVNLQGATLERLAKKLAKVAETDARATDEVRHASRLRQVLAAIGQELSEVPARSARGAQAASPDRLTRLVDRASKLAFQIAMEVARLGSKGERLLPMTQDLEELTTELRGLAGDAGLDNDAPDPAVRAVENIRGRLAEVPPEAATPAASDGSPALAELAPSARSAAEALMQVSRGFNTQTARLEALVDLASKLTGIDAPAPTTANPKGEPGNGLLVDCFDPFRAKSQSEPGAVVADPFASANSIFSPEAPSGDFSQSTIPDLDESPFAGPPVDLPFVETEIPATPVAPTPPVSAPDLLPALDLTSVPEPPSVLEPAPDPTDVLDLTPGLNPIPTPKPVSDEPPRVPSELIGFTSGASYDEMAIPTAAPPPPREPVPVMDVPPADHVYDLAEFDAVALAAPEETTEAERVYDLSEFEAVRVP